MDSKTHRTSTIYIGSEYMFAEMAVKKRIWKLREIDAGQALLAAAAHSFSWREVSERKNMPTDPFSHLGFTSNSV